MASIFQRIVSSPPSNSTDGRITLAAFGKHPAWDDYLGAGVDAGIGVDTETLAQVKQVVHVEGIRGQMDSGAWEKLQADGRLDGFDHLFLWLRRGHTIAGRLWSSTDGKRRRYPMVVCLDCEGVSPEFVLEAPCSELEALRRACQAATTAEQVVADLQTAQERLQRLPGMPRKAVADLPPGAEARRRFLDHAALGPNRRGLLRVLHELGMTAGVLDKGSGHLRLPLVSDRHNETILLWAAFLKCAVPGPAPLLFIARSNTNWIDVVIGEPAKHDFFCLQASQKAFPLATDVPYEISTETRRRLSDVETRFLDAGTTASTITEPRAKRSRSGMVLLTIGAVALVMCGVVVFLARTGRGSFLPEQWLKVLARQQSNGEALPQGTNAAPGTSTGSPMPAAPATNAPQSNNSEGSPTRVEGESSKAN